VSSELTNVVSAFWHSQSTCCHRMRRPVADNLERPSHHLSPTAPGRLCDRLRFWHVS